MSGLPPALCRPFGRDRRALIVADLHLDGDASGRERFAKLFDTATRERAEVFLLGDVFHYWFGRRHLALGTFAAEVDALKRASAAGIAIYMLPGNRDFLLDATFARATGVWVGRDRLELSFGDERVHLSHGDLFSTSDLPYLAMRRLIRSWPIRFLAHHLPRWIVERIAARLRAHSQRVVQAKAAEMLEPDRGAIAELFQRGYDRVVCGHYHQYRNELFGPAQGGGRFIIVEPFEAAGYVLAWQNGAWCERRLDDEAN